MYKQLADTEASRAIFREVQDKDVPILVIRKVESTYVVGFKNAEKHPAGYRMPGVAAFVKSLVLPLVNMDVSGEYQFEPHDAMREPKKTPTLCFARDPKCENAINFPDYYQMFDYQGLLKRKDSINFEDKIPKVLFAGTTTGPLDPAKNRRVQACLWAPNEKFDFSLTSVCQMTPEKLREHCGSKLDKMCKEYVEHEEHFRSRYLLNIEGNTCCWSRLPMIMSTNSLTLHMDTFPETLWYYPLLESGKHYVSVDEIESLPEIFSKCEERPEKCKEISANARAFVEEHCNSTAAAVYAARLFEALTKKRLSIVENKKTKIL
jgi:hypothetical protein